MKKYRKRKILLIVVGILIIFRLCLPTIAKNYLNSVLADIPGYKGSIEDVDIALYRGAYVIKGLELSILEAETETPFITLPQTDISVEWKSLFKGSIVSEIFLTNPEIIYVMEDQDEPVDAEAEDWTKALDDIVPLAINHFEIIDGKISFMVATTEPKVDLAIEEINLNADNLSTVVDLDKKLPSNINMKARTFGDGNLNMKGSLNLLKEIPDMDISFKLEGSNVTALNDFTNYYGKFDFESGIFNVYGEMAIADSYLKGYVKPFIKDAKFNNSDEGVLKSVWEGLIGTFNFILKNQKTDNLAMKVPFEGDLENIETKVWPTIISILKNGWIKAFEGDVDETIDFKDALEEGGKELEEEEKEKKNG